MPIQIINSQGHKQKPLTIINQGGVRDIHFFLIFNQIVYFMPSLLPIKMLPAFVIVLCIIPHSSNSVSAQDFLFSRENLLMTAQSSTQEQDSTSEQKMDWERDRLDVRYPLGIGLVSGIALMIIWPEDKETGALAALGAAQANILQFVAGFFIGFIATAIIIERRIKAEEKGEYMDFRTLTANRMLESNIITLQPYTKRCPFGHQTGIRLQYNF